MITSTTRRYSTLLVIISLLILSLKIDVTKQQEETKERVLVVQAHPDDETYFGGLIYKTASDLQGVVDIVVVTDGQGGYNCSIVAEWHYHRKLTDPMIGRENLPFLRKQEMLNSARILSVRDVFFLGEPDVAYTTNVTIVLDEWWDVELVEYQLVHLLVNRNYSFVVTVLPTIDEHGEHKAATILALNAIQYISQFFSFFYPHEFSRHQYIYKGNSNNLYQEKFKGENNKRLNIFNITKKKFLEEIKKFIFTKNDYLNFESYKKDYLLRKYNLDNIFTIDLNNHNNEMQNYTIPLIIGGSNPGVYQTLPGYPITAAPSDSSFLFNRSQPIGDPTRGLNYVIYNNWAISEHKSQGCNALELQSPPQTIEYYWYYDINPSNLIGVAQSYFNALFSTPYREFHYCF